MRVILIGFLGFFGGQVGSLVAGSLGKGGPWAVKGSFQLDQASLELPPREMSGANVGS